MSFLTQTPSKAEGFTLIELLISVAIIGIIAATAIPQYQSYIAKAQFTSAMRESSEVSRAVESCIDRGNAVIGLGAGECDPQATGSRLLMGASQGAPIPVGTGVPQIAPSPVGLTPTVTATFSTRASNVLAGQSLTWTRTSGGTWRCTSGVPSQYKSSNC